MLAWHSSTLITHALWTNCLPKRIELCIKRKIAIDPGIRRILYSMGEDGENTTPIQAKQRRDDVIRANNGGHIGLARGL